MKERDKLYIDSLMVLYSLRYALKRIGPACDIVRDNIFSNIKDIHTKELEKFIDEIKWEINSETYRDDVNKRNWNSLVKDIESELKLRKDIDNMYNERA